ncbi:MAG: glycosyltransferase Gtf1 [Candidatus Micrarchaeota archaeon]|nr:MAG: glycosyltransferase Gtf1 [Candidatus Micrarchaeota archaeon]
MKLLIMDTGSFFDIGGAEKDTADLYRYLKSKGDIELYLYGDLSKLGVYDCIKDINSVKIEDLNLIIINSIKDVVTLKGVGLDKIKAKLMLIDRGDLIVHMHRSPLKRFISRIFDIKDISNPESYNQRLKSITSKSRLILLREIRDFLSKSYNIYLFRSIMNRIDVYIAINATQMMLAERYIKRAKKIYQPIAPHKEFRKLEISKDYEGAIYVGRLEETQKRVSFIIKGIRRVIDKHGDLKDRELLRIIGDYNKNDGPYYKELVRRLSLEKNIRFIGALYGDDLVRAINNSGFIVSASKWESFSRNFIEAMACGIPVLTDTRNNVLINYNPEEHLIKDGYNGLIYKYNCIDDFADKFYLMLNNKQLRDEMADNAYKFVKERFDIDKNREELYSIIKSSL